MYGKSLFESYTCTENMSTLESEMFETAENSKESAVKPNKANKQSSRQKLQAVQARIKYREKMLKRFQQHLQKGTFPKRFKCLKPYPKMNSKETQAVVDAACGDVEYIILEQMAADELKKLREDQSLCEALKEERKLSKGPKMLTALQLQQELKELQAKYAELCSKLETHPPTCEK